MILMYCYGSSFHASRFRFAIANLSNERALGRPDHIIAATVHSFDPNVPIRSSNLSYNLSNEKVRLVLTVSNHLAGN